VLGAAAILVTTAFAAAPVPPRAAFAPSDPSADVAYTFARGLALAGPRPAGSAAERSAHRAAAARFRAAGLRVSYDRFAVPGRGRSRNVVAVQPGRASCLRVLMAHTDSDPPAPGALDNASGVGLLVGLAPLVARAAPSACETWLVATGAEERGYTGRPDHLGASALVRRLRREGRTRDVRFGLSLDEVGAGSRFDLYSPAPRSRAGVERALLTAARAAGVPVRRLRDASTGNSDHRELELAGMPAMKLGVREHACRHRACDRAGQLRRGSFRRTTAVVVRLLGVPATPAAPRSATLVVRAHRATRPTDHDTPARPAEAR